MPIRELTALTVDGRTIAVSGSTGGVVRVWDVDRMQPIGPPLVGHDGYVTRVRAVTANGQLLVVSGAGLGEETLRVWHVDPDAPPDVLPDEQQVDVVTLGVDQVNGASVIVTAGPQGSIRTYRTLDGRLVATSSIARTLDTRRAKLDARPVTVSLAEAEPDPPGEGNGADTDRHVGQVARVHDVITGRLIGQFLVIDEPPDDDLAMLYSGDELLLVGARHNTVALWNRNGPFWQCGPYTVGQGRIRSIALGQRRGQPIAVVCDGEGAVWVLELVTGQLHGIAFASDPSYAFVQRLGATTAIVLSDESLHVWDLETLEPIVGPLPYSGDAYAVDAGTVRGRGALVFGGSTGTLHVWDLDRRIVRTIQTGAMILALAVVDDESIVVGGPLGVTMLQLTDTLWAAARPTE